MVADKDLDAALFGEVPPSNKLTLSERGNVGIRHLNLSLEVDDVKEQELLAEEPKTPSLDVAYQALLDKVSSYFEAKTTDLKALGVSGKADKKTMDAAFDIITEIGRTQQVAEAVMAIARQTSQSKTEVQR